jgi:hypothetical protein
MTTRLFLCLVSIPFIVALASSCATKPAPQPAPEDVLVLDQAKPNPPKKIEIAAPVDKPKKQVTGKIIEITEVKGEQKFVFIKLGSSVKGVKSGVEGDIYLDPSQTQKIGQFKIIEVFDDVSRAEVNNLSYKIGKDAIIAFDVFAD